MEDTNIADKLAASLSDVQRQLLILENRQLVDLAKAFGPNYGARLTANGMETLEATREQPAPSRTVGF